METKHFHKYIIFLAPRFFQKSTIFKSIYERIRKKLENKGIYTMNITDAINEITRRKLRYDIRQSVPLRKHDSIFNLNHLPDETDKNTPSSLIDSNLVLHFDDMEYPSENILYVHLFNGTYYNDKIYPNKKLTLEREMLFLLAGNLGVREITYEISTKENIITRNAATLKLKGVKNQIAYTKTIGNTTITKGNEKYINNGAPLYCSCSNIDELNNELERTINASIFSYEFYKTNPKLETFVYKRLVNKMNLLMYTTETEDLTDISFMVNSCFADFGLYVSYEQTISTSDCITYTLTFYDDRELQNIYFKMSYLDGSKDQFYMIKQYYDSISHNNKESADISHIKKYIYELASKYHYKPKGAIRARENLIGRLNDYIRKHGERLFKNKCRDFSSTMDIKIWIYNNLIDSKIEEIDEANFLDNAIGLGCIIGNSDTNSNGGDRASYSESMENMENMYREHILMLEAKVAHYEQLIQAQTERAKTLEQCCQTQQENNKQDDNPHQSNMNTIIDIPTDIPTDTNQFSVCVLSRVDQIDKDIELKETKCYASPRRQKSRVGITQNPENIEIQLCENDKLAELKDKYNSIENQCQEIKAKITRSKLDYEKLERTNDQMIETLLIELNLSKTKLRSLNEKQVLEQIKALGKVIQKNQTHFNMCNLGNIGNSISNNGNNTSSSSIIDDSKNALRKLFSSDNDSLERQTKIESNNINKIEKQIEELKTEKEQKYQEIKKLTCQYDILIEEKNKIILECNTIGIDISTYISNKQTPSRNSNPNLNSVNNVNGIISDV